ncbi:molybdate ABC transporter substrate-binding protein [Flavimaricola marinus]|uniref:Molybdate-binding protein ModA n=1 Tax=Flavimaricola marinus TaxID=1819565 RepID=A0A238LAZ2_9RHOB|nr:molybdate ABC transporter substrate-binding protein [Flavimaricola marinus]SMY06897.1 Molybdate-binding periplasmic protein precursor [Flavimaricola marinus]
MIRIALLLCLLAAPLRAEQVVVFAAASLANALDAVAAEFEAETGHDVVISYGGSATMAQQIRQGAPAHLFVSANSEWMDVLEQEGLIREGSRADLLSNTLVLIGAGVGLAPIDPAQAPDIKELLGGDGRLSIGLPDAVPAGQYARAALQYYGQWEALAPHLAPVDNVRAALMLVALGEAPLGIVYATDAVASDAVTVLWTFPPESHPPIRYPVAELAENPLNIASVLRRYLNGPVAREIFEAEGFEVLPQ